MSWEPPEAPPARRAAYHIGEIAARTGRSVHAIRWYEAQGLVPGVDRDAGGRRIYGELHLGWLELMDRLRRTGMSIAQMRVYTTLVERGRSSLAQRREFLAAHRDRVKETIAEWTEALRLIDAKVGFYDEWLATGHRPRREVRPSASSPRAHRRAAGASRSGARSPSPRVGRG